MVYVEITPFGGSIVHITRRGEELSVSVTFSGAAGTVEKKRVVICQNLILKVRYPKVYMI